MLYLCTLKQILDSEINKFSILKNPDLTFIKQKRVCMESLKVYDSCFMQGQQHPSTEHVSGVPRRITECNSIN